MTGSGEPITIVLADDHTLLREALREVLLTEDDLRVVGEAGDGPSVISMVERRRPDVVLLDMDMPGSEPAHTARRLLEVSPGTAVIVLTMLDAPQTVRDMVEAGVSAYLHKGINTRDLVTAIRSAKVGTAGVTMSVSRGTLLSVGRQPDVGVLSDREQQVLALVAMAMSNRQIAARLDITEGTVKRHLRNIFAKLGAVSRIDAVNKARR